MKRVLLTALTVALVVAAVYFRRPLADAIVALAGWVDGLGAWGPAAFTAAMTVGIPLCLPAAPFLLAAGVLFGAAAGTVYAALGNLLGGALAFLLGRRLLRRRIEKRLASEAGLRLISRALAREGVRGAALVRLSPILPAWLLNYALGVSRVRWRDYWLSSFTILPTVLLYAMAGAGLGDLAALEQGGEPPRGTEYYVLLGGGILATLVASLLLARRSRRILDEMED